MKLGFIGTGKISSAVVQGLCTSELQDLSIMLSPRNEQTAEMLSQTKSSSFSELSHHAATPKGMNEQAAREISASGAHAAYQKVLDRLLERFPVVR